MSRLISFDLMGTLIKPKFPVGEQYIMAVSKLTDKGRTLNVESIQHNMWRRKVLRFILETYC